MAHSSHVGKGGALSPDLLRQVVLDLGAARKTLDLPAAVGRAQSPRPSRTPEIDPSRLAVTLAQVGAEHSSALTRGDFLNVWTAAGLGRKETRNTEVLAWWLNPRGTHGLGAAFLSSFLAHLDPRGQKPPGNVELSKALVRTELQPHGDDADRIDIAIDIPGLMVWIEAKIDAGEGHRQLERYEVAARRFDRPSCLVYLSRSGLIQSGLSVGRANWHDFLWRDVARIAREIALSQTTSVRHALEQYADHVASLGRA